MQDTDTPTATETITIVPAGKKEMSHVIMLAHRIWPSAYAGILTPEQIDNMLLKIYSYENLQAESNAGHRFWVAYAEHLPVGFSSAYIDGDIIWLKKLYVDPDRQGKRIGVRLMHTAVSEFLPAAEIRLLANPKNIPAHNFYQHLGFTKIGEVPVRMGDWAFDDFMFSLPLTEK